MSVALPCVHCFAAVSTSKCSRCLVARYCSKECQCAHWPTHKSQCRPPETKEDVSLLRAASKNQRVVALAVMMHEATGNRIHIAKHPQGYKLWVGDRKEADLHLVSGKHTLMLVAHGPIPHVDPFFDPAKDAFVVSPEDAWVVPISE